MSIDNDNENIDDLDVSSINKGSSDDWLTVKGACEYLKISEQTIFRWMKAGKVTYYKVGNSTRFKMSDLDMVVEKVVGQKEGEILSARCAVCGHGRLVEGKVSSTGNMYFTPLKTKFWVWAESTVPTAAKCCPSCGHIQLMADTSKLNKLTEDEERE
ncbi:MAG: helix-turn-helix domain-containing protein [Planctomycetota bacterium]|jgi:excisionase family DNA binding protein